MSIELFHWTNPLTMIWHSICQQYYHIGTPLWQFVLFSLFFEHLHRLQQGPIHISG